MDKHTSLLMCLRTQNSRAKTWKHLASIIKNISNKKTVLSPTSYRHKWLCMTVFGHLGIPFFIVLTVRLLFQLLFCLLMVFGFQLGCIHRSIHLSFSHMFILRPMLTFVNNPIQMWDTIWIWEQGTTASCSPAWNGTPDCSGYAENASCACR